ncbi:Hypothetical protein UVM_LOCUS133 [uncultured virus]|nr:Hypothetical protein UVM_LOCUS133 [uncultured virus]
MNGADANADATWVQHVNAMLDAAGLVRAAIDWYRPSEAILARNTIGDCLVMSGEAPRGREVELQSVLQKLREHALVAAAPPRAISDVGGKGNASALDDALLIGSALSPRTIFVAAMHKMIGFPLSRFMLEAMTDCCESCSALYDSYRAANDSGHVNAELFNLIYDHVSALRQDAGHTAWKYLQMEGEGWDLLLASRCGKELLLLENSIGAAKARFKVY